MSTFMRELGMTALSWSALLAFRIRVSMSAMGSVSIGSPARFRHAGDGALVRELAQADAAEAELAEHRARATAAVAARVSAHLVLRRAALLDDQALLGHYCSLLPSPNGRPRACSSARAWSSVWALVVMVTSRPRTF